MLLIQINTHPVKLNIMQIDAPTGDKPEEELEQFYDGLEGLLGDTHNQNMNIVMGDFNAKIGEGRVGDTIGPYGLGVRNQRGNRLLLFAESSQLVVINTFFVITSSNHGRKRTRTKTNIMG